MTLDPKKDQRRAEKKAGDGASEGLKKKKRKEKRRKKKKSKFPVLIKTLVHIICQRKKGTCYALRHLLRLAYCPCTP